MRKALQLSLGLMLLSSCVDQKEAPQPTKFQTMSLLGDSLFIPSRSSEAEAKLMANINEAQKNFDNEQSEINFIWLGRRWAYLGDYRKAITIYSEGLKSYPNSYKLLRHRGHRYVSLREFEKAIVDFEKAYELMPKDQMEIEPDGLPNKLNQPLSNTQFNILYHWGLAEYLRGNFAEARRIYGLCMDYSKNNDLLIATSDWLYMTLRRLGLEEEAKLVLKNISADMEIVENESYHKRLLMYKGELAMDSLFKTNDADASLSLTTQGYGVANWYLYNADTSNAMTIYLQILESDSWSPFGFIAAENDLQNIR